jgi:hypothetical protein
MYAERQHSILVGRLLKFGKWLATPPSESSAESLNPRAFTDQLCNLQKSLHLAGEKQPEPVKIVTQVQ